MFIYKVDRWVRRGWSLSLLVGSLLLLAPAVSTASPPLPPSPWEVSTATGRHTLNIHPDGARVCRLTFNVKQKKDGPKERWARDLDWCPVLVMVTEDGRYVVLFDQWGGGVHPHGIVVLDGADGHVRGMLRVDEILDAKELRQHGSRSRGLWRWTRGMEPRLAADRLTVETPWGRSIDVALATGTLLGPKPKNSE